MFITRHVWLCQILAILCLFLQLQANKFVHTVILHLLTWLIAKEFDMKFDVVTIQT